MLLPPAVPLAGEVAVPMLAKGSGADDVMLVEPELVVVAEVVETVVDGAITGAAMKDVPVLFVAADDSFVSEPVFSIGAAIGAVVSELD